MNTFFEKMESMFKEVLDHPVPALLLVENKKLLVELANTADQDKYYYDKYLQILKNFLIIHGYKNLQMFFENNNGCEYIGILTEYKEAPVKFAVSFQVDDTVNLELRVAEVDYIIYIMMQRNELLFIKPSKLNKLPMLKNKVYIEIERFCKIVKL